MTARIYDFILNVANGSQFTNGSLIMGANSKTIGLISNVNSNNIRVKINNNKQYFNTGERVFSNITILLEHNAFLYYNTNNVYINNFSTRIDGVNNNFPVLNYFNRLSNLTTNNAMFQVASVTNGEGLYYYYANVFGSSKHNLVTTQNFATTENTRYAFSTNIRNNSWQGLLNFRLFSNGNTSSANMIVDVKNNSIVEVTGWDNSNVKLYRNDDLSVSGFFTAPNNDFHYFAVEFLRDSKANSFTANTAETGSGVFLAGLQLAEHPYEIPTLFSNHISVYFDGNYVPNQAWDLLNGNVVFKPITGVKQSNTNDYSNNWEQAAIALGNSNISIGLTAGYVDTFFKTNDLSFWYDPDATSNLSVFTVPSANISNITMLVQSSNRESPFFMASYKVGEYSSAQSIINNIYDSPFIREKNAFQQNPIIRLYTIYYPGEWYPPNEKGNPTDLGAGLPWPTAFPLRIAEVPSDSISDVMYRVLIDGVAFTPYPTETSSISLDSTGKINSLNVKLSNFDNLITTIVENPYLVGNNNVNGCMATVNGELVHNIDPRTVIGNVMFDQDIVDSRGGYNLSCDYTSTNDLNGYWNPLKLDSRDLLGAVVEIKTTFANFLDVWPEFSVALQVGDNIIEVLNSTPYRIGDLIKNDVALTAPAQAEILNIYGNHLVVNTINGISSADNLYIINPEACSEEYTIETFKIESLEGLNETIAEFNLTSWLQYFKLQVPKRKYYKNTCPWVYRGEECQYPAIDEASKYAIIPGTANTRANGFFNIRNESVSTIAEDVCAHNLQGCMRRNNEIHFGGFENSGTNIPR